MRTYPRVRIEGGVYFFTVKHGYARASHEWPHSSFARWTERGLYSENWAARAETVELNLE